MATLSVGAGQAYSTIAAAVNAAKDGDTVLVQAGTYVNDFVTVTHRITMQSVGGLAVMAATVSPPNGKAILTADASLTIDGFGFTGAAVSDQNGAGIRYEAGDLVVRNSAFWDNQDGILANGVAGGTILIQNSEFSHNGAGDGRTHNLYVGNIASLVVENSYFHDSVVGHEIKSRAASTTITGNRIQDNAGNGSYSIDIPDGGVAVVRNNIIEKGPNTENSIAIHYGGEGTPPAGSSLLVSGNTIINDRANGYLITNFGGSTPVVLTGNQIYGFATDHVTYGSVTASANTVLAARPTLNLASILPAAPVTPPPPTTTPTPVVASDYVDFGRAGAVAASGRILSVGARAAFTTLQAALAAARDGDTIQVAAGTYVNDFANVTKKVIIEGVGGMARFVESLASGPQAIFTIAADATLRNIEVTGATQNDLGIGINVTAGHATLTNVYVHDNSMGLSADSSGTSVSVYDSDFFRNGGAKNTNGISVYHAGSFTLDHSYVHGGFSGHEVFSLAYNTVITNDRIIDGAGAGASFLVDLGQGGKALVQNNVLDKGPDAANGILVHVGGEDTPYDNSNVRILNNWLQSDLVNAAHPYTYFIVAETSGGLLPVTVAGNTFAGGANGSAQLLGATAGTNAVGAKQVLDTSAGWSAATAAGTAAAAASTGPNVLTLKLTEVAADVDAQFVVSIDGTDVGGGVVTAADSAGTPQTFTYSGWWGSGAHSVVVRSLNLLYKASPSATNLIVKSATLDGAIATPPGTAGTLSYAVTSWAATLQNQAVLPGFDAAYYLAHNPDVKAAGLDPLQHYLLYGWKEGRDPSALFNTRFYLAHNPDVAAAGVNPLLHFERYGWTEGRDPSAVFSVSRYLAAYPDAGSHVDPLADYALSVQSGAPRTVFNPGDPLVDAAFYMAAHPDVAQAGQDAGTSYHQGGWNLGFDPDRWFSTQYYLAKNPDVAAAGVDPLLHFETYGWKEGRDPSANFSLAAYNKAHPASAGSVDPLLAFIQSGEAASAPMAYGSAESALFDPVYYLAHNPDVAAAHADPLLSYELHGWQQGRDPSASFSTTKYLAAYSDVRLAGVDPLEHYALHGRAEGRVSFGA